MNVSELTVGMSVAEITGRIEFHPDFGRQSQTQSGIDIRHGMLNDGTGKIRLTLWQENAISIHENANLRITNAYVKDYNGNPELALGRNPEGAIEVLDGPAHVQPSVSRPASAQPAAQRPSTIGDSVARKRRSIERQSSLGTAVKLVAGTHERHGTEVDLASVCLGIADLFYAWVSAAVVAPAPLTGESAPVPADGADGASFDVDWPNIPRTATGYWETVKVLGDKLEENRAVQIAENLGEDNWEAKIVLLRGCLA